MSAFRAPTTVPDALAALAADPGATLVAGGTDLLPAARTGGRALPASLVSLHAVDALRGIADVGSDGVRIGAATTHAQLAADGWLRDRARAIVDAAGLIGGPATRAVATLGGNLVNGSPAMDLGAPLLVHDAAVESAGPDGRRVRPLADWLAAGRRRDELLTAVLVPRPPAGGVSAYVRHGGRGAMDVALAGAAVLVARAADGTIGHARVALTAVAPTCVRVPAAEALLVGAVPDGTLIAAAAAAAVERSRPIDDDRAPADYRRALVAVAVRRALREALR